MREKLGRLVAVSILAGVSVIGMSGCASESDPAVTTIGAADLLDVAAGPDVVVLDVRTPEEYAEGHVPGSINIDVSGPTFTEDIEALPKDATYVVYCRSGNRSAQAASQMADAGFTDVYDVDAGLETLAEAGVPVTP